MRAVEGRPAGGLLGADVKREGAQVSWWGRQGARRRADAQSRNGAFRNLTQDVLEAASRCSGARGISPRAPPPVSPPGPPPPRPHEERASCTHSRRMSRNPFGWRAGLFTTCSGDPTTSAVLPLRGSCLVLAPNRKWGGGDVFTPGETEAGSAEVT